MFDFYKMGAADFWGEGEMLDADDFAAIWLPLYYAGRTEHGYMGLDYGDYVAGFEEAWAEHDLQIDRIEKPWRFEGFGCESRSYEPMYP